LVEVLGEKFAILLGVPLLKRVSPKQFIFVHRELLQAGVVQKQQIRWSFILWLRFL